MENMMIEALKMNLIKSAMWTNDNAAAKDINRNHVNYGSVVAYANVLSSFGVNVDVPAYEDECFLKIPKLSIESREIKFER